MPTAVRVMCVDDNPMIIDALRRMVTGWGGYEWAGSQADASRLGNALVEHEPDVLFLDIDMPGPDPIETVRSLRRAHESPKVIVLSGHSSPELVDRALDAGIDAFLSKDDTTHDLREAVRRVLDGEIVLGREVLARYTRS